MKKLALGATLVSAFAMSAGTASASVDGEASVAGARQGSTAAAPCTGNGFKIDAVTGGSLSGNCFHNVDVVCVRWDYSTYHRKGPRMPPASISAAKCDGDALYLAATIHFG